MKIWAYIFLTSLGFAVSRYTEDILDQSDIDCIKELGLETDWVLDNLKDGVIVPEGNPDFNNLMLCSYKTLNAYDESTKMIDFNNLKGIMVKYANLINGGMVNQEQIVEDAFESCKSIEGSDPGDRLVKFDNCVMKKFAV